MSSSAFYFSLELDLNSCSAKINWKLYPVFCSTLSSFWTSVTSQLRNFSLSVVLYMCNTFCLASAEAALILRPRSCYFTAFLITLSRVIIFRIMITYHKCVEEGSRLTKNVSRFIIIRIIITYHKYAEEDRHLFDFLLVVIF